MAVVVFDNNGGGGDGNWSTATNWVGNALPLAADTADINANCTLDIDDIVAILDLTGCTTFTMNANSNLTGMTASVVGATCEIVGAQGGSLEFNLGANCILAGKLTLAGVDGNTFVIKNVGAGAVDIRMITGSTWDWVDFTGKFFYEDGDGLIIIENSELIGAGGGTYRIYTPTILRNSFIAGSQWGVPYWTIPAAGWQNVVIGYRRDGTASALSDFLILPKIGWYGHIYNLVANVTNPIEAEDLRVSNLGHIVASMLPGTGSALDLTVVGPGIGKTYRYSYDADYQIGTAERSTAAKKSGDYGTRVTPGGACSSTKPMETEVYIPIATGDNISGVFQIRRHDMSDDCAEAELDPEGALFTPHTHSPTLTNDDWTEVVVTGAGASGSGNVRIVLRLKEYEAAKYCDFADGVVTVTHADASTTVHNINFDVWAMGQPAISEPSAGGGLLAANKRGNKQ